MNFIKTILHLLNENEGYLKTSKTKPIVDAIKNKNKITFMYNGPRKPAKVAVKPGKRINAEPVAIGLSKKGNLIIRAWVGPPSVSKKGFDKTNWRTFMVSRMLNVQISDEIFDLKPGFKPNTDKSMSVTYVTSDTTKTKQVKPQTQVKPMTSVVTKKTEPKPIQKPEEPKKELPQPKPIQKPEEPKKELPQPKLTTKPEKTPVTQKPEEPKTELPQPKQEKKPDKTPTPKKDNETEPSTELSESISRIKTLMLY